MSDHPRILIVGTQRGGLDKQIQALIDCEPVCTPDGPGAVTSLRLMGHTISSALLNVESLEEDLEELVVYLKSTYSTMTLGVLGQSLSSEEKKRLKLLGVAHFLDKPLTRQALAPMLLRNGLKVHPPNIEDWKVTVDKGDWVEITVPTKEEYVSRIQDLLDLLERSKLDENTRDELMLAIDELVTNAMEWGNRYDTDRQVQISYYCALDRVILKVEDEGEGFNTAALGDPTEDLEGHMAERQDQGKRPGGFGIHMIRNLMDEFIYNDRGNIVMLTKYLDK